jgi:hypothetical protein
MAIRTRIYGEEEEQTEEAPKVYFRLERGEEGVKLIASNDDGESSEVLVINNEGLLIRTPNVSENLGLSLNPSTQILMKRN